MSEARKAAVRQSLAAARQDLFTVLQSLDDDQWDSVIYSENESWRISDLLRHLNAAEYDMTQLIERIRSGESGVPEDFDLNRWNARSVRKALDKSPAQMMAEMEQNRKALLELIDSLQDDEWALEGRHGSLRIMSVEQILQRIADHEVEHAADIRESVSQNRP
jgi:uncharacterized damage-inducible protein DinB